MNFSPAKQPLVMAGVLLLWCAVLIGYRLYRADDAQSLGLLWNLFLAVVPLFFSRAFRAANQRKRPLLQAIYFVLWLLFLPNAPYLLTDLIHLAPRPHVPLWYMLALLLSCAGTGTLLGYLSLTYVQTAVAKQFGQIAGWAVVAGSLMLCGFGIYLGRFLRWNSWDAVTNPLSLFKTVIGQFIDPGPYPHPLGVTLVFGSGLIIGYLALHAVSTAIHNE